MSLLKLGKAFFPEAPTNDFVTSCNLQAGLGNFECGIRRYLPVFSHAQAQYVEARLHAKS